MNIVLPIIFWAVAIGLFARRLTPGVWWATLGYIALVLASYWVKHD